MNRLRFFVATLLPLFLFVSVSAKSDAIDRYIDSTLKERNIPGAVIAVLKDGKIVKMKGYGLASVEFGVPVTTKTVFEIGSVTKQITAGAIMILVEEGKVSLDEKISVYIPATPTQWKDVTVRHLLNHTSGIPSYSVLGGFGLSLRMTRDDFVKKFNELPLDFEPGTKYAYNNSGYNLLGYIIESQSGMSYWRFLEERIYKPLGIKTAGDRDPRFIIRNRATGYEFINGSLTGRDGNLTDLFAAGAIVMSIEDLVKWENSLRNATLLKKDSLKEMWTPLSFNDGREHPYGLGFRLSPVRDTRLVGHSGQTAGFGTSLSRFVEDDVTVIAITNLGEDGMGTLLALGVAKLVLPKLSLSRAVAAKEEDPMMTALFTKALGQRLRNESSEDLFTSSIVRSQSTARSRTRNQRIADFGPIVSTTYLGSDFSFNYDKIHRYLVRTGTRYFVWRLAMDENGKIAEMTLEEEEPIR
jgi:D-alanyl-D-alanine carboxypeptidase